MRSRIAAVFSMALGAAAPAFASFHLMKIMEVFPGTVAAPNAQYVMIRSYAAGQTLLGSHQIHVYDAVGTEVTGSPFTFPGSVANGPDQMEVLIATPEAATLFNLDADLTMTPVLPLSGGKVCYDAIDCVAWGSYHGSYRPASGTPVQRAGRARPGAGHAAPPRHLHGGDDPRGLRRHERQRQRLHPRDARAEERRRHPRHDSAFDLRQRSRRRPRGLRRRQHDGRRRLLGGLPVRAGRVRGGGPRPRRLGQLSARQQRRPRARRVGGRRAGVDEQRPERVDADRHGLTSRGRRPRSYAISSASADYGTIAPSNTASCATGGDCYAMTASMIGQRPIAALGRDADGGPVEHGVPSCGPCTSAGASPTSRPRSRSTPSSRTCSTTGSREAARAATTAPATR